MERIGNNNVGREQGVVSWTHSSPSRFFPMYYDLNWFQRSPVTLIQATGCTLQVKKETTNWKELENISIIPRKQLEIHLCFLPHLFSKIVRSFWNKTHPYGEKKYRRNAGPFATTYVKSWTE